MVIDKRMMRFVRKHKSKYIGAIIMIALSCMMFIGFNIASPNIKESISDFRKRTHAENVNFTVSKELSADDIKNLEKEYDCEIENRKKKECKLNDGDVLEVYTPSSKVNKYEIIKGDDISNPSDIILDANFASANKYKIGDNIEIDDKDFKITGYYAEADQIYIVKAESEIMPNPKKMGIAIISEKDYDNSFGNDGVKFYSAFLNKENIKELKKSINEKWVLMSWISSDDNVRINFIDGEMNAFSKVGYLIPIIILVISSVMIAIVSVRQIKMEYSIIGTVTALGYRKKEIIKHYIRYPLFQCLVGSIAGLIPGIVFALIIGSIFLQKYNMVPIKAELNSLWILPLALVLPFIIVIPFAFTVLYKSLNFKPIDLMNGHAKQIEKKGSLYRKLKLKKLKFRNKYRVRDAIKNIPRTIFLICGITFSSMLLLFGFTTIDSINNVVDDNYNNVYKYEFQYDFKSLQSGNEYSGDKINYSMFNIQCNGKEKNNVMIYGVTPDNKTIVFEKNKNEDNPFEKNIITSTLAKKLKVSEGDTVSVINKYSEISYDIKIDEIVKTSVGDYIYTPLADFNKQNMYPGDAYIQLLSKEKLNIDNAKLISATDKETQKDNFKQLVSTIKLLVISIWVVSIVISVIIINTVSTILIEENRINISLFKVLGYKFKEINSLTLKGNIIMVVVGYIISIPLIIKTIDILFAVLMSKMSVSVSASLNPISMLIGLILIVISFEIALHLSKKKIMNISMSDVLKERNE